MTGGAPRIATAVACLAVTAGCGTMLDLRRDLTELDTTARRVTGEVAFSDHEHAVIVLVLESTDAPAAHTILVRDQPEAFSFYLQRAPLLLFAFMDSDNDLALDAGESCAWFDNGKPLAPDQDRFSITLNPVRPAMVPAILRDGRALEWTQVNDFKLNIGTVTSLSDARFSVEQGTKGMWQPLAFVKDGGAGIHFLEPYDRNREPVLFVHGLTGAPQEFGALIQRLDRRRFQPWVASYPSGFRLPDMAQGMYRLLADLQYRYRFKRLHIVAHSMGGLVIRGFINECARRGACAALATFTTISTPWGGHAGAASGVKHAPEIVPAWIDMAPGSDYLATLFATPLPARVRYDLLFSFKRTDQLGEQNDDGTVTLASQLREEAQQQARSVHGYDETHTGILDSELVAERLDDILRSH